MSDMDVRHNRAGNRFEIFREGTLLGFLTYEMEGETYALNHTEVFPQYGGKGIGTSLVVGALAQIRESGNDVLPYCPFIPKVMLDHPGFIGLVPAAARPQFGLE